MKKAYTQLTSVQRNRISRLRVSRLSVSEIARKIGVHKSTISRELKRNGRESNFDNDWFKELAVLYNDPVMIQKAQSLPDRQKVFSYITKYAQRAAEYRRYWSNQTRTRKHRRLRAWVIERLKNGWSPQQIAGRSKLDGLEPISHEAIYQIILRDKKAGGRLYRLLPRFGRRKQRFNHREYTEIIPDRRDISERPKIGPLQFLSATLHSWRGIGYWSGS